MRWLLTLPPSFCVDVDTVGARTPNHASRRVQRISSMNSSSPNRPALTLLIIAFAPLALWTAQASVLWQIGAPDRGNAEFALAPADYHRFQDDAFFVVGQSEAKHDWPYVQPGPADGWAGGRAHTFTVLFGLAAAAREGECHLEIALVDTHSSAPPRLRIQISGVAFNCTLPNGAGDNSINGQPANGKAHKAEVVFPARLLKQGNNRIEITTASGSWMLYDSLTLTTPEKTLPAPVAPLTELASVRIAPAEATTPDQATRSLVASVIHVGPAVEGVFKLDDEPVRTVRLAGGRQTIEIPAPAVERARGATLALTVAGRTVGQRKLTLAPALREVVVVFKTHFDIGYTDMASNVVQTYRTKFMDSALGLVEESRALPQEQQFVWTLPGWPLQKILEDGPGQTPERQERVRHAVKEGRFVVHALPFTTHTELLEPEDLVRGLGYSSQLARGLDLDLPRDAKMTDVPSHSWILPTLLRNAGVEFLHLGCNAASSSPELPALFWWEGPDGSRLLTMYSAAGYGTGLVPPENWPYSTWLALIHSGDNHGPPSAAEVAKVFADAKQRLPGVKVRIGRLSDFADAIMAERADIPVVRGDMPDTWIHGPMSDPQGAKLAREIRPAIAMAESLHTQLAAWGIRRQDVSSIVARANEQSLLYGEHTWGGAQSWVTAYGSGTRWGYGETWQADRANKRFERLEGSWAEHTAYIEAANELISPVLRDGLWALGGGASSNQDRRSVVIYNPLPWRRGGRVFANDLSGQPTQASYELVQGSAKHPISGRTRGTQLEFVCPPVPAMGAAPYHALTPKNEQRNRCSFDDAAATLQSPSFKVQLDPARGCIRSLRHRPSGRELVDAKAPHGFGQLLYERFASNNVADYVKAYVKINADWAINELGKPSLPPATQVPYRRASPRNCRVTYDETSFSVRATLHADASADRPFGITTTITLFDDLDFVDLEITVYDKPADPWPEAGWVCLPFKVDAPQFRLGRLGSIIDPTRDIVRGANKNLFAINTGLAIFGRDGSGVGVCPVDSPLVSLGEPGGWKYDLDFAPKKPAAYINLFNNQWTTNFRMWNQGTWTSRVRLWAFGKYNAETSLITPSLEARYPLQAVVVPGGSDQSLARLSGLKLSRRGTLVTTFGNNPDGSGTVLRLWELAGQSGNVTVRLPEGLKVRTAQPVNLRGVPTGDVIAIKKDSFRTTLRAFAPASFVLQQ